jgi:hypothetical protein
LTESVEIRAQGILREVLFPQPRREEMDVKGGMGIDALEHIDEIDVGINALEAARSNQTLDDADIMRAHFGPAEQPVPSAQSNGANRSDMVLPHEPV